MNIKNMNVKTKRLIKRYCKLRELDFVTACEEYMKSDFREQAMWKKEMEDALKLPPALVPLLPHQKN